MEVSLVKTLGSSAGGSRVVSPHVSRRFPEGIRSLDEGVQKSSVQACLVDVGLVTSPCEPVWERRTSLSLSRASRGLGPGTSGELPAGLSISAGQARAPDRLWTVESHCFEGCLELSRESNWRNIL